MTKREKGLQKLRNQIARLEASREAAIKMLVKAEVQLPKLGNRLRRLTARNRKKELALGYIVTRQAVEKKLYAEEPEPKAMTYEIRPQDGNGNIDRQLVTAPTPQDDDIPSFLERGMKAQAAVDEIVAEQAAEKKRKAERRIAKLKISQEVKHAELTGQRRKMPLTGKDAMAALRR